ncbi:MAG: guanylate kinase [Neomegalonema sp.]|nr:guanylate kinase [Neomegalonema sp.]
MRRRGMMLVVSSPSGAGKTTLSKRLLGTDGNLVMSVSATTRPPRAGEVDGEDYHFMARETFRADIDKGAFLEHAEVHDNFYGTPRGPVEAWLEHGRDVLFDVDWQGAQQLRQAMRDDMASVFVLPPSMAALEARLRKRGKDSDAVIERRLANAVGEISHWAEYDYVIVNDDIDASEAKLRAIMQAERLRRARLTGLSDFIRELI